MLTLQVETLCCRRCSVVVCCLNFFRKANPVVDLFARREELWRPVANESREEPCPNCISVRTRLLT